MTFDGTVSLGSLIAALSVVVAVLGTYGKLAFRLGALETKVNALWEHFLGKKADA